MAVSIPRVVTPTSASGAQVIDGSLVFNGDDQYLTKTFSNAGNRRTFSFSFWVKRSEYGATNMGIFSEYPGSGNGEYIRFSDDSGGDTLRFVSTELSDSMVTERAFRDIGWYHICVAVDTTQAIDTDRVKIYINGERNIDWASVSWPSQNEAYNFMSNTPHYIGRCQSGTYFPGSLSQFYVIDGQSLGPGYFGYTDPLTNTWRPKAFKAEGTTVNDGTTWSSTGTLDTNPANAFDGNTSNYAGATSGTKYILNNVSVKINSSLRVYHNFNASNGCYFLLNGNKVTITGGGTGSFAWSTLNISSFTTLTSLALVSTTSNSIAAVEVDGVIMIDGKGSGFDKNPNNTTNWSSTLTTNAGDNFDASGAKINAFDGNGSTKAYTANNTDGTTTGTSYLEMVFPSAINGVLRVKCDNGNTVRNVTGGGDVLLATQSTGSDNQFVDCGTVSGLTNLRVLMSGGSRPAISIIELDGYVYIDGTVDNSFYLPMDGSLPIGDDQKEPNPINHGMIWSGGAMSKPGHASYPIPKAFDGSLSTYAMTANSNGDSANLIVNLPGLPAAKTVRFYGYRNTNAGVLTFNGGAVSLPTGAGTQAWVTAASTTLGVGASTGVDSFIMNVNSGSSTSDDLSVYAMEVDGVILIDNMYGNGFAPVTFGGSTELDKATGALPILNTANSGNIAASGIRSDYAPNTPEIVKQSGCVSFDGSGDYFYVYDNPSVRFGTDDFAVEGWFYIRSYNSITYPTVISKYDNGDASWILRVKSDGKLVWYAGQVGGGTNNESGFILSLGTWHYVAVCREGTGTNETKVYLDGALAITCTDSSDYDDANPIYIGRQDQSNANEFDGFISNLRVSKGTSVYTSAPTPPSEPLTNIASPSTGSNDGTHWSEYLSGTIMSGYWASGGFDGDVTTGYTKSVAPDQGSSITFTPPSALGSSGQEVIIYYIRQASSTSSSIKVNGSTETTTYGDNSVRTLTVTLGGSGLTSVELIGNSSVAANTGAYLCGIKVNGVILTDGVTKLLCCQSKTQPGSASEYPLWAYKVSGDNDGTQWSALMEPTGASAGLVKAGSYSVYTNFATNASKAFDGDTGTQCWADSATGSNQPGNLIWTPPSPITISSTLKLYCAYHTNGDIKINGTSIKSQLVSGANAEYTITGFTSIENISLHATDGSNTASLRTVEVDGVILVDPMRPFGIPYASDSEVSASCVLALPLTGPARDVSSDINISSTLKAISLNGSSATYVSSNFYGGSWDLERDSSQYLSWSSTETAPDTGDFTYEVWFNTESNHNYMSLMDARDAPSDTKGFFWGIDGSGQYYIYYTGSVRITAGNVISTGRWYHGAVTREGGILKMWLDGVLIGTYDTSNSDMSTDVTRLGSDVHSAGYYFDGKLQDARIYIGVAKYTSNFIPASTNSNIVLDSPSGAAYSTLLPPLSVSESNGGGGVKLNGESGNWINAGDSSDYAFGTGDFTIEMYVQLPYTTRASHNTLFATRGASGSTTGFNIGVFEGPSGRRLYVYSNSQQVTYANEVPTGWTHIAVSRSGTSLKTFINGVEEGTGTNSLDLTNTNVSIGSVNAGAAERTEGYISNVRLTKGVARYTSNFNPPTEPLKSDSDTVLLCCQSSTDVHGYLTAPGDGVSKQVYSANPTIVGGYIEDPEYAFFGLSSKWSNLYATTTSTAASIDYVFPQSISNVTKIEAAFDSPSGSGDTRGRYNGSNGGVTRTGTGSGYSDIYSGGAITVTSVGWGINQNGATGTNNEIVSRFRVTIGGTATILTNVIGVAGDVSATKFNPFMNGTTSSVLAEPGGNYATMNPLNNITGGGSGNNLFADGNLKLTTKNSSSHYGTFTSTLSMSSGKYYAEVFIESTQGYPTVGVCDVESNFTDTSWIASLNPAISYYGNTGKKYVNGAAAATYGYTFGAGDTIGIAVDLDWLTVEFFTNGTSQGVITGLTDNTDYFFGCSEYDTGSGVFLWNFGQRPFRYEPPQGFQPLNSATLPSPGVVIPDSVVGVTTYTGSASPQTVGGINFTSDFIWIKSRTHTGWNILQDSVRGFGKTIFSNDTNVQVGNPNDLISNVSSNGFSVNTTYNGGTDTGTTTTSGTNNYVAWTWKAGGAPTPATDLVFGVNTDDNGFDSSSTSRTYDTTSFSFGSYSIPQSHPGGTYGANSAQIYKSSSGQMIIWSVSTTTASKYIWTSSDGINWSSPGSQYDTTTSPKSVTSKWIALAGGANAANLTITGDGNLFRKDGVGSPTAAIAGLTGAVNCTQEGASVGTKQGFSITLQESGGSGDAMQIPHGLTQKPDFIIGKDIDTGGTNWAVYHSALGAANKVELDSNGAAAANANYWSNTEPTSSVVYSKSASWMYPSSSFIMYSWHNVPGLQKFGKYVGTDNGTLGQTASSGPFIDLGFRPAIMIFKDITSTQNWIIIDDKRSPYNLVLERLFPNSDLSEYTNHDIGDFCSTGFRFRGNEAQFNDSDTYIYAAWAADPSGNLYRGQSKAH